MNRVIRPRTGVFPPRNAGNSARPLDPTATPAMSTEADTCRSSLLWPRSRLPFMGGDNRARLADSGPSSLSGRSSKATSKQTRGHYE